MRYSREVIDQIRQAASLLQLAGELTTLRPVGRRHYGLCPFHEEKTPSFSIDPQKGLYFCHGCNHGGDVIAFHRKSRGLSFSDAVVDLAKRFGIVLPPAPEVFPFSSGSILEAATEFYARRLLSSPVALAYLQSRAIPLETATLYRLGYAGAGWQDLLNTLVHQYGPARLLSSGLIARSERGHLFDRLRNRIVLPVTDAHGQTAGLASRSLDALRSDYRFTPGTPRRRLLFGLPEALRNLGSEPSVLVVEGFFDVLSLAATNTPVVAAMSNRLTQEQAVLLARYVRSVTLFPDRDEAGLQGMADSLPLLLAQGLSVRHVLPPEGEDPDSFLRKEGAQALSHLPVHDTLLEHLAPPFLHEADPAETAKRMSDSLKLLRCIPDPTCRIAYAQHAAKRLGLPPEVLLRLLLPDLAKRE